MHCTFCHTALPGKIHFRDTCPICNRDLHTCKNCDFFDPQAHLQCRESIDESIGDKERANFCESFRPGSTTGATDGRDDNAALKKLEALFKT
ncbi:MAG: hypothetical protein A2511_16900 [Deltaproteobacteria bacterium RIFOXYD12_FULL_50_9]|nr:MAG: hypothetical protein A2511_16900 [Deltaproteobacteria bacterium RIFOXYD12_FULL_50_9]